MFGNEFSLVYLVLIVMVCEQAFLHESIGLYAMAVNKEFQKSDTEEF